MHNSCLGIKISDKKSFKKISNTSLICFISIFICISPFLSTQISTYLYLPFFKTKYIFICIRPFLSTLIYLCLFKKNIISNHKILYFFYHYKPGTLNYILWTMDTFLAFISITIMIYLILRVIEFILFFVFKNISKTNHILNQMSTRLYLYSYSGLKLVFVTHCSHPSKEQQKSFNTKN